MVTAAEIANAWEKDRRKTEAWLDDYVDANPNLVGVVVATTIKSSVDLGAGFVDLLRLGEGVAEGGWGWGADGLRVVGLLGPLGRGAKMLRTAVHARGVRLIVDPGGPLCSWVNSTAALRRTGQKLYASVDDFVQSVATKLNRPGMIPGGVALDDMVRYLGKIGARIGGTVPVNSLGQIRRMLPRDGSVVLVSVKGLKNGREVGGHAIHFFRDTLGRLRISDRSGVYKSLEELAAKYPQVDEFIPRTAAHLKNMFMKFVGPKGTATLVIGVNAVFAQTEQSGDGSLPPGGSPRQMTMPPMFAGSLPPVAYLTGVRARLMNLGYYAGPIRGEYDPKSRAAVMAFQKAHPPLAVDGIPGPKTQARLKQVYGS